MSQVCGGTIQPLVDSKLGGDVDMQRGLRQGRWLLSKAATCHNVLKGMKSLNLHAKVVRTSVDHDGATSNVPKQSRRGVVCRQFVPKCSTLHARIAKVLRVGIVNVQT